MAAHRYWRILFTAGRSGGQIDLGWVKFFDTADIDATVAANPTSVGGSAIAGEQYSGSYAAANAFSYGTRGETADNWASLASTGTFGTTKWIGYDFGATTPKDIKAYSISVYSSYYPSSWYLQWSDDNTAWTTQHSVTDFPFFNNTSHFFRCTDTLPAGDGSRYWRIVGSASGSGFSIAEVAMRATPGGANLLVVPYTSIYTDSNLNNLSYQPRRAIDGLMSNSFEHWIAANNGSPHWWMADFGKRVAVGEVVLNTGLPEYFRGSVKVQSSDDDVVWIDRGTFAPFTTTAEAQTLIPTSGAPSLQKRRMLIVSG